MPKQDKMLQKHSIGCDCYLSLLFTFYVLFFLQNSIVQWLRYLQMCHWTNRWPEIPALDINQGPGWVAWLVRESSQIHQGCRFKLQSGYIEEATTECIRKWNKKSVSLSLYLLPSLLSSLSLKSINKIILKRNELEYGLR